MTSNEDNENENESDKNETMNQSNKNILKGLNDNLDEIIDYSKSFEEQVNR